MAFSNRTSQVAGAFEHFSGVNLDIDCERLVNKMEGDYIRAQEQRIEGASGSNKDLVENLMGELKRGMETLAARHSREHAVSALRTLFPVTFFPNEQHQEGDHHLGARIRCACKVAEGTPLGHISWMAPLDIFLPPLPQPLDQFDPDTPHPSLRVLLISPKVLYQQLPRFEPDQAARPLHQELFTLLRTMMDTSEAIAVLCWQNITTTHPRPWFGAPGSSCLPLICPDLSLEDKSFIKSAIRNTRHTVLENTTTFMERVGILPPGHHRAPVTVFSVTMILRKANQKLMKALEQLRRRRKRGKPASAAGRKRGASAVPATKVRKVNERVATDRVATEEHELLELQRSQELQKLVLGVSDTFRTRGRPPDRRIGSVLSKVSKEKVNQEMKRLGGGETELSAVLYERCRERLNVWHVSFPLSVNFWRPFYHLF